MNAKLAVITFIVGILLMLSAVIFSGLSRNANEQEICNAVNQERETDQKLSNQSERFKLEEPHPGISDQAIRLFYDSRRKQLAPLPC